LQTYYDNYLNMAKTCLEVLKDNCSRLRKSLSLEAFACLEVRLLGHDRSVLLSAVAQALLLTVACRFPLSLPLPMMPLMDVNGNYRILRTGFRTEARHRCRVPEEGFYR
jgi:hypothetical protein